MTTRQIGVAGQFEEALARERGRLVGLCARLTGAIDVAEDLAQETLVEAWRHRASLRDADRLGAWLTGIARNVCRRWLRQRGLEQDRIASAIPADDPEGPGLAETVADPLDIEVELERHELVTLLDRALALLPPATRAALVARYVDESPYAEIAARLGVSEGAVKLRVQRGKLLLSRRLTTDLKADAAPYLDTPSASELRETRIWCPICGQRRLRGRFDPPNGELFLSCPACGLTSGGQEVPLVSGRCDSPQLFEGVKGFKPALTRELTWNHQYYRAGLARGLLVCGHCGRPTPLHRSMPTELPQELNARPGMHYRCQHCQMSGGWSTLRILLQGSPEGRRFWRRYPRLRSLPPRAIETAGGPAIVTTFESVTSQARLTFVSARETFALIAVDGGSAEDARDGDSRALSPCAPRRGTARRVPVRTGIQPTWPTL